MCFGYGYSTRRELFTLPGPESDRGGNVSPGEGTLLFPSALRVRIFRNSTINTLTRVVEVNPNAPVRDKFSSVGTTMLVEELEAQADRRLEIDSTWAYIEPVGTRFFVRDDPPAGLLWIVVIEGVVRVTIKATGQTIDVPAQWQFWYQNGQPVQGPVPAPRPVIDALLGVQSPARIEVYAPNALRDEDLLSNPQCTVTNSIGLNLRAAPDRGAALLEVLENGARFEATGRFAASGGLWLSGLAPSSKLGWSFAYGITCAYEPSLLPEQTQAIPPALPITPLAVPATATPTPAGGSNVGSQPQVPGAPEQPNSITPPIAVPAVPEQPSPTPSVPTVVGVDPPRFIGLLRLEPLRDSYLYYPQCPAQDLLDVGVEIDASTPSDSVELVYRFLGDQPPGEPRRLPMGLVQSQSTGLLYTASIDVGQEAGAVLQGKNGLLEIIAIAVRGGAEFRSPSARPGVEPPSC